MKCDTQLLFHYFMYKMMKQTDRHYGIHISGRKRMIRIHSNFVHENWKILQSDYLMTV